MIDSIQNTGDKVGQYMAFQKTLSLVRKRRDVSTKKKELHSRIREIDPSKYLDITQKPDLNVIILVVDCLRNSHMSHNGYSRGTTPFMSSFQGSRFGAVSASSWTYPSVASILTGLYPHNHNAVIGTRVKNIEDPKTYRKIRSNVLTLPEILYLLGYRVYFGSAIDIANLPLRARTIPREYESPNAENLLADLGKWISKKGKRFFAYLQLGDLHEPIDPPDDFRNFFGVVRSVPRIDKWDYRRPEEQKGKDFEEYKKNRILLYDNTLRYVDHAIEQLYAFLESSGLTSSTIFLITADHGEEFWEHAKLESENFYDPRGYYGVGHGHNVFKEIVNVPVVVASLAETPSVEPEEMVSTVDIMPTIVDLLGIRCRYELDGQNVFKQEKNRPLLCEAAGYGYEKKALTVGKYKLILSQEDGVQWVFHLERDPDEENPIVDEEISSILMDRLRRLIAKGEKRRAKETIQGNPVS